MEFTIRCLAVFAFYVLAIVFGVCRPASAFRTTLRSAGYAGNGTILSDFCQGSGCYREDSRLAIDNALRRPTELHVDTAGNLYIADAEAYRITKVFSENGTMVTVAGSGDFNYQDYGNFPATSVHIYPQGGLATDLDGNLFFSELTSHRIRIVFANGTMSTFAGNSKSGITFDGNSVERGSITAPINIVYLPNSSVSYNESFVYFEEYCRIRRFPVSTFVVQTIAGRGMCGVNTDTYFSNPLTMLLSVFAAPYVYPNGTIIVASAEAFWTISTTGAEVLASYDELGIVEVAGLTIRNNSMFFLENDSANETVRVFEMDLRNVSNGASVIAGGKAGTADCTTALSARFSLWATSLVSTDSQLFLIDGEAYKVRVLSEDVYCTPSPAPTSLPSSHPSGLPSGQPSSVPSSSMPSISLTPTQEPVTQAPATDDVFNYYYYGLLNQPTPEPTVPAPSAEPTPDPSAEPTFTAEPTTATPSFTPVPSTTPLPTYTSTLSIATIAGGGLGSSLPSTSATDALFTQVHSLWVYNAEAELYLLDHSYGRLMRVFLSNRTIADAVYNDTGEWCCDNLPAAQVRIRTFATTLAGDADGNVFFCEQSFHRIRVLLRSNNTVWTVAGANPGSIYGITDDGRSARNAIRNPVAMSFDVRTRRLYFFEKHFCFVRYFVPWIYGGDDSLHTIAGTGGCAEVFDTFSANVITVARSTALPATTAVYADSTGAVYVSGVAPHYYVFKVNDSALSVFAGTGVSGVGSSNIAATSSSIGVVAGISGDTDGNVYLSYTSSSYGRLRVVAPSGLSTLVISSSSYADCVSVGEAGLGGSVGQLSVDSLGQIYIADTSKFRVRVVGEGQECAPSFAPTPAPTNPTSTPSSTPTRQPSDQPTSSPSSQPTMQPSQPSAQPSAQPSLEPTSQPSAQPSAPPSATPTRTPTALPSVEYIYPTLHVSTVAGNGSSLATCSADGCYSADSVLALDNAFGSPDEIFVDLAGDLWIADSVAYRIVRVFGENGTMQTMAGSGKFADELYSCCDGMDALQSAIMPGRGLSGDGNGTIFFSEAFSHRIRAFFVQNGTLSTVAGSNPGGNGGITQDGDSVRGGLVTYPGILQFHNRTSSLFFLEQCRIRAFNVYTGEIRTVAGRGACDLNTGYSYFEDALAMALFGPQSFVVDRDSNTTYIPTFEGIWIVDAHRRASLVENDLWTFTGAVSGSAQDSVGRLLFLVRSFFGNVSVVRTHLDLSAPMVVAGGLLGDRDCVEAQFAQFSWSAQSLAVDLSGGTLYLSDVDPPRIRAIGNDSYCRPTQAPTSSPSSQPSSRPSSAPSLQPSAAPSAAPTTLLQRGSFAPSEAPTTAPPTLDPNHVASYEPTAVPTEEPSALPTEVPSFEPTLSMAPSATPAPTTTPAPTVHADWSVATVAGGSFSFDLSADHVATSSGFVDPRGVFMDYNGTLWIADASLSRIMKVESSGHIYDVVYNSSGSSCCDNVEARYVQALTGTNSLTGDTAGNIYYNEQTYHRIRIILASNSTVWTVAGVNPGGVFGLSSDGSAARNNYVRTPVALFYHTATESLYFIERFYCRVRAFSPWGDGALRTYAGTGSCNNFGSVLGEVAIATSTAMPTMSSLFVDTAGDIYVGATAYYTYKITGGVRYVFAGTGTQGVGGSNVQANTTSTGSVLGITGDTAGNIYLSYGASSFGRIRVVVPGGASSLIVSGDAVVDCAPVTSAGFSSSLYHMTIDPSSGDLFVAESANYRVRAIGANRFCAPSAAPSEYPTEQPSAPTELPTHAPSVIPSTEPSWPPTELPTHTPSTTPSAEPSWQTTETPSITPSGPSKSPTHIPSALPTVDLSAEPSVHPTAEPTFVPSVEPTHTPSEHPSATPSVAPTAEPPTTEPTDAPSAEPTVAPNDNPSAEPSTAPTAIPSHIPTPSPSVTPSLIPSEPPSRNPTQSPTAVPTLLPPPSFEPSIAPSRHPSPSPSQLPSADPTRQPTAAPSTAPTHRPSEQPTRCPTALPSATPSQRPSALPTVFDGKVFLFITSAQMSSDATAVDIECNSDVTEAQTSSSFACTQLLFFHGIDANNQSAAAHLRCRWQSGSSVKLSLDASAATVQWLLDGDVSLRNDSSLTVADAEYPTVVVGAKRVPVTAPSSPQVPAVALDLLSDDCNGILLDIGRSTGHCQRPWLALAVNMSVTSTSSSIALDALFNTTFIAAYATDVLSAQATDGLLRIPHSLFGYRRLNATVLATIRLCNVLRECRTGSLLLNYTGLTEVERFAVIGAPIVRLSPSSTATVFLHTVDPLVVTSEAFVPQCATDGSLSYRTADLQPTWMLESMPASPQVVSVSADPFVFRATSFSFIPKYFYSLFLSIVDRRTQITSISTSYAFTILSSPLVAVVSPAQNALTLSAASTISLDASQSFDPDLAANSSQFLRYNWTCTNTGSPTNNHTCLLSTRVRSSGQRFTVTGTSRSVNSTHEVVVFVSDMRFSYSRNASSSRVVFTSHTVVPIVRISTAASDLIKVTSRRSVMISATVSLPSSFVGSASARWALTGSNRSVAAVASGATMSVTLQPGQSNAMNLLMLPSALRDGARFSLELSCGAVSATAVVVVNSAPYGGSFEVAPVQGTALATTFTLSAQSWLDDTEDFPLRFMFSVQSVLPRVTLANGSAVGIDSVQWLPMRAAALSSMASSLLPVGRDSANYSLLLLVSVYDVWESAGVKQTTARVLSPVQRYSPYLLSEILSNASASYAANTQQVISVVLAYLESQQENANNNTYSLEEERQVRQALALSLNASLTYTDIPDVIVAEGVLQLASSVVRSTASATPDTFAALQDTAESVLREQLPTVAVDPLDTTVLSQVATMVDTSVSFLLSNRSNNASFAVTRALLSQSVSIANLIGAALSRGASVTLSRENFQLSLVVPITATNGSGVVVLPTIALPPASNAHGSTSISISVGANSSKSGGVAVTVVEYSQEIWQEGRNQNSTSNNDGELQSNIIRVDVDDLSSTNDDDRPVFVANLSHVVAASGEDEDLTSPAARFHFNCSEGVRASSMIACPGGDYFLNVTCFGTLSANVVRSCPVRRRVCNVLSLQDFVVTDRTYCRTSFSSLKYTICECGEFEEEEERRQLQTSVDDDFYYSTTGGGKNNNNGGDDVSSSAVSVAVMSEFVAGDFASTVSMSSSVSATDVAEGSVLMFYFFGGLWGAAAALVVAHAVKAYAETDAHVTDMSAARSGLVQDATRASRRRGLAVVPVRDLGDISAGQATDIGYSLAKHFRSYIELVLPRVYRPKSLGARFWVELCHHHSYLRVVATFFRPHTSRREHMLAAMDVVELLTSVTLSLFLLALLYDLQYPVDDGSCFQHRSEAACLQRKSLLDVSQTYCLWSLVSRRRPATIVGQFAALLLQNNRYSLVDTDNLIVPTQDAVYLCEFNVYDTSFRTSIVVAVVTSCFTALLMRPLSFLVSVMKAKSKDEVRARLAASSALLKSGPSASSTRELAVIPVATPSVGLARGDAHASPAVFAASSVHTLLRRSLVVSQDTRQARRRCMSDFKSGCAADVGDPMQLNWLDVPDTDTLVSLFLHQWQQYRTLLSKTASAQDMIAFESAWELVFSASEAVIASSHVLGAVQREQRNSVLNAALDSTAALSREIYERMSHATEVERGMGLLQAFFVDLLGTNSSAAKFFTLTVAKDFTDETGFAVKLWMQIASAMAILGANVFALYYILLRAVQQGRSWQRAFLLACVAQLVTEVLFFQPFEIMYIDLFLPSLAHGEMRRCQRLVHLLLNDWVRSDSWRSKRSFASLFTTSSIETSEGTPVMLPTQKYFFASFRAAAMAVNLVESQLILHFQTSMPDATARPNTLHTVATGSSNSFRVVKNAVLRALLRISTTVPLELQRLIVRFFEPFLLGGLVLMWLSVQGSVTGVAVFSTLLILFVCVVSMLCYRSALRSSKETSVVDTSYGNLVNGPVQMEVHKPEVNARKEEPDVVEHFVGDPSPNQLQRKRLTTSMDGVEEGDAIPSPDPVSNSSSSHSRHLSFNSFDSFLSLPTELPQSVARSDDNHESLVSSSRSDNSGRSLISFDGFSSDSSSH